MKIIGWVRLGDASACGAIVLDGNSSTLSQGRAYTFQGARMDCPKRCTIAEGFRASTLSNGLPQVTHGMRTTGGCPLYSTLNGVDGLVIGAGQNLPIRFIQDETGAWTGKTNEGYDQHFVLIDDKTGTPLCNRYYRMTFNGRVIEGKTDWNGITEKVTSDDPADVTIEIMPEGYAGDTE